MALLRTLQDGFDGAIDTTKWTSFHTGTSTIAQSGGVVTATPPATTAGSNYAGYDSVSTYDLTGNYMVIEITTMVNVATNAQCYAALILDANNKVQFLQQNGSLKAQKVVAGVTTTLQTTAYSAANHLWWRIREAAGLLYFETSADGTIWTQFATPISNPFAVTVLSVEFAAGTFQSEVAPGSSKFDNFNLPIVISTAQTPKTYRYHSYKNSVFQGVLTNVISDFAYQAEINSAGSAVTILLGVVADNYGEGTLVDFNNNIVVYEIDDENPNGLLIFSGFIVNYKPSFTEDNQENVELTVMGYGATLNDYMIEATTSPDATQNSQNGSMQIYLSSRVGLWQQVYQSFVVGGSVTKLVSMTFKLAAASAADIGDTVTLQICSTQGDIEGNVATNVLGSASQVISSTTATDYNFNFASPLTVTPGGTYYARLLITGFGSGAGDPSFVNVYYDSAAPYGSGSPKTGNYNGVATTSWVALAGDLYFISYSTTGLATTIAYTNSDPSAILKSIIDNYNTQGGRITYTPTSIDLTGTSVTYAFNTNTVFEGVGKCLDLAPVGWYWYIDQANNVLHFHKVSSVPSHKFTIGKDIKNLTVDKRSQEIANIVYFVGGPTGGVNLYQKYVLQSSIDQLGRHAIRYTDTNVTLAATAQIIANSILSNRAQVELRVDLDIIDNAGQASSQLGFNIESITLGESVSFRSFGPGTNGSLWDQAKWDINKWDFDITDISSIIVQVTKIDYSPDILHLSLSTVPPDITKRIESLYRALVQTQVLSNPSTPT
jgi:hypothetical protein